MPDYDYTCPACGASFASKRELELHRSHDHEKEPDTTVRCRVCGSQFPNQARLELHMEQHHAAQINKDQPAMV
jgi:DNA-directed RNA polymerase subunit RPC12/RpoP